MTSQCDIEYLSKELNTKKGSITRFLHKHFKENINYTISTIVTDITREKSHGGNNRLHYTLSKECIELIKNSYNLKHRYVTKNNTLIQTNIVMTLENSTI